MIEIEDPFWKNRSFDTQTTGNSGIKRAVELVEKHIFDVNDCINDINPCNSCLIGAEKTGFVKIHLESVLALAEVSISWDVFQRSGGLSFVVFFCGELWWNEDGCWGEGFHLDLPSGKLT